jgi:glutamate/aspartate transport system permease protein
MNYHWNWAVFLSPVPSGETDYLGWLLVGLQWTLILSLLAWVIALVLGTLFGIMRTLPNRFWAGMARAYVEVFRNLPLLVQLFFWYFVLPELLPKAWGEGLKRMDPLLQQFLAAWLCLGMFTSARLAEQVRSGIQSIPRGQQQAGLALGLSLSQVYRLILLPQALRWIMPPLTSEFLNVFKNSSVATTIGLIELSRQAQQLVDYTAQPYEAFIAVTLCYLLINVSVMQGMRILDRRLRLPGQVGHD